MQSSHTENLQNLSIVSCISELQDYVLQAKNSRKKVALVPTMGALHDGHMALVLSALELVDLVIVSIFVNPVQFSPDEDFKAYPRTWEEDIAKLAKIGAHCVYHPAVKEMYPNSFNTTVSVSGVSEGLCGNIRSGHFDGVATIVTKLLLQCAPDITLFGEKDYQQLCVVKRLVLDLNIPVEVIGVPTVRDENGLALSSRNKYLSEDQYITAIQLNKILFTMSDKVSKKIALADVLLWGQEALRRAGFNQVDYLEIRKAQNLERVDKKLVMDLRILAAVHLGQARLIDNVPA